MLPNTMIGFQKEKNMRRNPQVTLFCCDPANPLRNIEVRGEVVEMSQIGAIELADRLTQLYTGKQHFYGDIYPVAKQAQETRVVCRIRLSKVNVDAIFE